MKKRLVEEWSQLLVPGEWHHVAFTVANGKRVGPVYVNGVRVEG